MARQAGLTEETIAEIDDGFEAASLAPAQKAAIRWADAFLADPARIPDALRAEMRAHFGAAQIVEMTIGLALFLGFSKIAIALGPPPPDMPIRVLPTPD